MKKSKILGIFLMVLLSVMLLSFTASAETYSGECSATVTWEFDSETGVLNIEGTGPIPDYSQAPWATYYKEIKSIVIADGITKIGNTAFHACDVLSVQIPNSVTSIGEMAFAGCDKMESIVIPDSVEYIDELAFYECTGLKNVTIGKGIIYIGNRAFENCKSVETINYTGDVNAWAKIDFISMDSNPAYLAGDLYINGELLTDVAFDEEITAIKSYSFTNFDSLETVSIPDGVTSIGMYSFGGCKGLKEVVMPDSVKKIGMYAFCWDTTLKNVKLSNQLTTIGRCAFIGCEAFDSIVIPDSVETLRDLAFSDCPGVKEIKIGTGLKTIGVQALSTYGEAYVTVDENNPNFSSDNGILYNKDKTVLLQYTCGNERTSFVVPYFVNEIGDYAFYMARNLKSVEIHDSVTTIGSDVFSSTGLETVKIAKSVKTIGRYGFTNAFGYSNIDTVYYSGTPEDWALMTIDDSNDALSEPAIQYGVPSHTFKEEVTKESTCTETGIMLYTCPCGYSYEEETALKNHSYTSSVTKEATCTEKGIMTYTCSCGESYEEEISVKNHSYTSVVTKPTCTEAGFTTYTCADCKASYTGNTVQATGHSFSKGECSVCHEEDPDYEEDNSFIAKLKEFFNKILEFFKNLFG